MPVITFSRFFPKGHPKAGQPTHFVEKIWRGYLDISSPMYPYWMKGDKLNIDIRDCYDFKPKHHTIRAGNRWKVGDKFSPRIWGDDINPKSGKSGPYQSKQLQFAPDIEVKKTYRIYCDGMLWWINRQPVNSQTIRKVATNDGLEYLDFLDWFNVLSGKHFEGQIICWNESINY